MRRFLLKILTGAITLCLLVTGLIACGSSSTDWTKPTLVENGNGTVYGGFMGETDNYIYFINGIATSTDDNTFGAPVKGSLMVQDKKDLSKEPQIVVPKLFASSDYDAGVYIYNGRVYYGTPCTDKNSSGGIANDKMTFASTKLDGSDTVSYFTVDSHSANYRVLEQDGTVYIVYYSTADTALYSYNTSTGENKEIIKTDAKAEGEGAVSLSTYRFLDNSAVKEGFVVAYTVTIYDEDYYEDKVAEGTAREAKKYNEVYVFGVFDGELKIKKVLDGNTADEITYAFHLVKGADIYATATDVQGNVDNIVYDIKNDLTTPVVNMDVISADSLILEDGKVITVTDGVVKVRYAFEDDKATQEIIVKNDGVSGLIRYDEANGYLYYYNKSNTICRTELGNEDAVETEISEDLVSVAWYDPQFMEIDGTEYLFYLDVSTKGASYVKYVNVDQEKVSEDTDEDGEADDFYLEGHKFLAKRLDKDVASFVVSTINDIVNDIDDTGALKFEENDGVFTVESVVKAKELFDAQTDAVKALIPQSTKDILENYLDAIDIVGKYATLKAARNISSLSDEEYSALYSAYTAVKEDIEEFRKTSNYVSVRVLLGNDFNAYYQKCVNEFEAEEN